MTHRPFWLQREALGRACAVSQQGQCVRVLMQKHQAHVCTQWWVTELRHTCAPAHAQAPPETQTLKTTPGVQERLVWVRSGRQLRMRRNSGLRGAGGSEHGGEDLSALHLSLPSPKGLVSCRGTGLHFLNLSQLLWRPQAAALVHTQEPRHHGREGTPQRMLLTHGNSKRNGLWAGEEAQCN